MTREQIRKEAEERVNICTPYHTGSFIQGYIAGVESREEKIAELKETLAQTIENDEVSYETLKLHDQEEIGMLNSKVAGLGNKITELNMKIDGLEEQNSYMFDTIALQEQQIEKMKRHCNCKHRDSEGYCEVKRTYLMDLSYDGCDKWELEND